MDEGSRPEAALFLNAGDHALHLGRCELTAGAMRGAFEVVAAVHRGAETFTHLYLVPVARLRARREVRLAAVFSGEALDAARQWAAARRLCPAALRPAAEIRLAA